MNIIQSYYNRVRRKLKAPSSVCIIHIGKCGGSTFRTAVAESEHYHSADVVHMKPPKFRNGIKYLVVARDPVERCVSAFNWRYKLVVEDGLQRKRVRNEYEILQKYQTLDALAVGLYDENGELVKEVATEFESIVHLKERVNYYLGSFLEQCPQKNIIDVVMTETLNEDIERVLKVSKETIAHEKKNKQLTPLSQVSRRNLAKYIKEDFECLEKLHSYGFIQPFLMERIRLNCE